uniref:Reverse transcriptase domain-containing protein n=1 Tax=Scylla olivacea TaxID=85551 RepID=A0A0P4VTV9_SCYOL
MGVAHDDATTRTVWLWDRADWGSLRRDLRRTDWPSILQGGAEVQARAFTSRLLALQEQHVPHRELVARPTDQPWFGYRCRVAAEAKYSAWLRYKQSPTRRNKDLHCAACKRMVTTCRWAVGRWEEDLRHQLGGPGVGNKTWWSLVKGRQGLNRQDTVPPLTRPDGTVATSSKDKAQLLATLFAGKMEVDDPERSPPLLEQQCRETVTKVEVTQGLVERLLQGLDVQKATGPDNISPHVLKQCARELAVPLTTVFSACLWENTWPLVWKEARVVPVHKRSSRSDPKNYRPISLLSVVGKVFERVVADVVCRHLQDNYLLSDQQFGFRPGRSTSDLLMLLTGGWQDALDGGLDSVVVALDIAGAFDRVWHGGLLEKLRAKGIQGDLLQLLGDYLQGRTLQVVVNGQASESLPVRASVPQGSVLGPVLWNIYVDDLLRQLPAVSAYADDCTLSCTYPRHESVRAAEEINQQLGVIQEWGARWQVTFAPEKTQAMVVSRSPAAEPAVEGGLSFGGLPLELQESVKILGVEVDRGLRFDRHVKHIALKASHRVSSLRRVANLLDRRGRLLLYKAQIRPYLEYAALSWMSCAATHISKLDGIQRRALRLVEAAGAPAHPEAPVDTLEHRRDVAALVVFHKAQVQGVPHLAGLRLPTRVTSRDTRTVLSSGDSVEVPRSRSSQHQRTFWGRVSRLWNVFASSVPHIRGMDTQDVKLAAHHWRGSFPTPLLTILT